MPKITGSLSPIFRMYVFIYLFVYEGLCTFMGREILPRPCFLTKEKPIFNVFQLNIGFRWSCYPDSNWRPHPYQVIGTPHPLHFQSFRAISAQKDEVFGTLSSIDSIRSFPRVGHGVGQAEKAGRMSCRTPVFSSCVFTQVTRATSSTMWRSFFAAE